MKVATFNVNSIRKRLPIVIHWLKQHDPDVLCLQETKVSDPDFPLSSFDGLGFHIQFRGMKTFNGVATLSKLKPEKVVYGLKEGPEADDFRIIQTVIHGIPVINTYVPQGTQIGTEKFQYKLRWFERLRNYFKEHLDPDKPAIWLGDMNVAPEPIDVYEPDRLATDPCFHPDARRAYKDTVAWGWVDCFRHLYPDRRQYTFWDFFRNHFQRDRGWRLDHIMATPPLAEKCTHVEVDLEPRRAQLASDHTVIWAQFNLDR